MPQPCWTNRQIADATHTPIEHRFTAERVVIDSRQNVEGALFVAIKGEQFDGHAFVAKALENGASAALVSHVPQESAPNAPLVLVPDTMRALIELARYKRNKSTAKYIGITGSVGKTSTKEMMHVACAAFGKSFATEGNLNNHIGVPLTLSRLPWDAEFAVIEMGMNHAEEIRPLSVLTRPHIAIITTVEAVHLEFFNSVEAIADAKSEILEGIEPNGIIILNRDNPYFERMKAHADARAVKIISFGTHKDADARLLECKATRDGSEISAIVAGETIQYRLGIIGAHQAMNSLAVLAAIGALQQDVRRAAETFEPISPVKGRGARTTLTLKNGATIDVLDDSYNASPASVSAAIKAMALQRKPEHKRLIAMLGEMKELGARAKELHLSLQSSLEEAGVDQLFAVGDNMHALFTALPESKRGAHAKNVEELIPHLENSIHAGDLILVKGSHSVHMERIVEHWKKQS